MNRVLILAVAGMALVAAALALQGSAGSSGDSAPVVLNWVTKSEVNTAGFYIYRSENKSGPYVQLNRDLIPASNDAAAGGSYSYTDSTTLRGVTYYYQLEDLETTGKRNRHEPITVVAGAQGDGPLGMSWFTTAALAVMACAVIVAVTVLRRRAAKVQ